MDGEQVNRIKEMAEQSNSFGLFSSKDAHEHDFLAREALRAALQDEGKTVIQIPEISEEFKNKWSTILPLSKNDAIYRSTLIRIPKNRFKIKEISYKEDDIFLTLHIKSENEPVTAEDIFFETIPAQIDAVFCFGESKFLQNKGIAKMQMPSAEKIIFINKNKEGAAEKIYEIIGIINKELFLKKEITNLLYASLVLERIALYRQSQEKTAKIEQDLLRAGADKKIISEILTDFLPLDRLPVF